MLNHTQNSTWIIDTGATDHMTNSTSHLTSIRSTTQQNILTANGGIAPVTHEGSVSNSNSLNLDTVLVVPSLSCNILSVGQITKTLNCTVKFWPNYCLFQDIATHRILGSGVKRGKLYYLDLHDNPKSSQVNNVSSNKDRVILWHRRLGHLSFHYLRKIKPELFVGITNFESKCDVCEMEKSHRISYVPSYNKNLVPFMTIHSDV